MRVYITSIFFITSSLIKTYPALVITPVADLVGMPLSSLHNTQNIEARYTELPLCAIKNCGEPQLLHQLLFNEVVEVLEEQHEQIKICVPYLFYISPKNTEPQNIYWTLKKNTLPLAQIAALGAVTTIPLQHDHRSKMLAPHTRATVSLIEPWHDKKLELTFSFGTRFVVYATHETTVEVWRYNPKTRTNEHICLPKNITLPQINTRTHKQSIDLFITLLRRCIPSHNGSVAYVLGGCSFTNRTTQPFTLETKNYPHCTHILYARTDNTTPKNGFDCSGLITRAAQMAGIPYFFKNTFTAQAYLQEIGSKSPEVGDLIWIPGHIMIISDIKKQLLIEARGYQHGYGIVQEIPLNKVFKNIETFTDLQNAKRNKKPVVRLDSLGQERDWYSDIKILSLKSCWKN